MGAVSEKNIMDMILSDYPWEQVIYRIVCEEAMDPWDVDISKLTDVFIGYLARMKQLDFRIPAKYIIIAAVLLKMKTDHLDFIDMIRETMQGPETQDMMAEGMEGLEAEMAAVAAPAGTAGFDGVRLHERRVHHRKVMFEELVFALRRALRTERRRERREAEGKVEIRIERVDISKRIRELYRRIDDIMAKLKEDEVRFSSLVGEWNREGILKTFTPLMHLDMEKKVDCHQDKPFEEIFIRKMGKKP